MPGVGYWSTLSGQIIAAGTAVDGSHGRVRSLAPGAQPPDECSDRGPVDVPDVLGEIDLDGPVFRIVAARAKFDAAFTRLLHKSWHVIVTRTPTFRVANASQNSPCSIRPCHDCRPIASVAYPHQR